VKKFLGLRPGLERSVSLTLLGFTLGASLVFAALGWLIHQGAPDSSVVLAVSIGLSGLFVAVGLSLLRIQASVARPLAELRSLMKRHAAGDHALRSDISPDFEVGELQAAFNQLVESVEDSQRQLRRVDEDRSELAATLSHELRTPLTSIRGYAQLVRDGDAGSVSDEQRQFLEQILLSADRMRKLIDEVIELERKGSEAAWVDPARFSRFDITELLRECLVVVDPLARDRLIRLELSVPAELCILADRDRLRQVLLNLLSNAVKYNRGEGWVRVTAWKDQDDGRLVLEVQDSGLGLSTEECRNLFKKFYRSEKASSSGVQGSGLGLYLSRRWVEAMNGVLSVKSEPGEGSTFRVELPAATVAGGVAHG